MVTLGADISSTGGASLMDKGEVVLDLDGHRLTVAGVDDGHAAIGVASTATLFIYDTAGGGQLVAVGGTYGAGIGGSGGWDQMPAASSGYISILGASVSATGGDHSAGIGGGMGGSNYYVSIGRTSRVVAVGTDGGPGIGSGDGVNIADRNPRLPFSRSLAGLVYVSTGAVVVATGGDGAAGIGGGSFVKGAHVVLYDGGIVTATGGENGAGVGGGAFAAGGLLTVQSKGSLTARGGLQGAGIGGGLQGDGGGFVNTMDSSVTAISGPAAGAGPGSAIGAGSLGTHFGAMSNYGKLVIPAGSDWVIPAPAVVGNVGFIRLAGSLRGTGQLRNSGWIATTGGILGDGQGTPGNLLISGHNYLLTFHPNGGSVTGVVQVNVYAESVYDAQKLLPTAVKSGSRFLGWYTDPVGGIRITATTNLATALAVPPQEYRLGPTTAALYAHWSD